MALFGTCVPVPGTTWYSYGLTGDHRTLRQWSVRRCDVWLLGKGEAINNVHDKKVDVQ